MPARRIELSAHDPNLKRLPKLPVCFFLWGRFLKINFGYKLNMYFYPAGTAVFRHRAISLEAGIFVSASLRENSPEDLSWGASLSRFFSRRLRADVRRISVNLVTCCSENVEKGPQNDAKTIKKPPPGGSGGALGAHVGPNSEKD